MNWIEGIVTIVCVYFILCMLEETLKALKEIKIAQINADAFKDEKK